MAQASITIGMVLFPKVTQLDLTGPFEVFGRIPGARVIALGASRDPVTSDTGLRLLPELPFAEAPALDVLVVPGGPGVNAGLEDSALLDFLAVRGAAARWVTSVCSGSLLLGAAGLLQGYRATSHWMSLDLLPLFGAIPVADRVVRDRNRITGGGVTAGIDFGLTLASELASPAVAQGIQLMLEYAPAPPFSAGHPTTADPAVVAQVRGQAASYVDARRELVTRVARARGIGAA